MVVNGVNNLSYRRHLSNCFACYDFVPKADTEIYVEKERKKIKAMKKGRLKERPS